MILKGTEEEIKIRKERRVKLELARKEDQKTRRKFCGKLEGFETKYEANFEKKHLEAYIKGQDYFTYGLNAARQPKYFNVKFEYITKD